jgi:hypothetical protein
MEDLLAAYGIKKPDEPVAPARPATPTDSLSTLFGKYFGEDEYMTKAQEAKKKRDELLAAYKGALAGTAQIGEAEPSQAERYFRLTQALLNPGRTGHFYEAMGNVSQVAAEMEKEKRLARRDQAMKALEAGKAGLQLDIEAAGSDIDLYTKLAEKAESTRGNILQELAKQSIKPKEAQSPAGKQAMDEGLTPGTADFHKRVAALAEKQGDAAEARLNVALANAALSQARFERTGTEMGASETRLLSETEDNLFAKKESKMLLTEALRLNPYTYDSSIADTLARFTAEGFAPESEKVVNTRDLENILTQQLLSSLRSTFGAAPTEGERKVLEELQGIESKSKKERERILARAMSMADARIKKDEDRIGAIRSGAYRYRTTQE